MSAPSIAPFLPFRRVRIKGNRIQADPAVARVNLAPDRRYVPRCTRFGGPAQRVDSQFRRRVRDLSLGAHRIRLRLRVSRLQCSHCEGIQSEGVDFVASYARVTRRLARYIAGLCRMLPVAQVAWHLRLDWKLLKRCDKAALAEEVGATDTWGLRLLAVDEIALIKDHRYMTVVLDYYETVRVAAYKGATSEEERRWIKSSRYRLFKSAENLSHQQRPRLLRLLEVNEQIHTAYLLRDHLKKIWSLRSPWAVRRALREWGELAEESDIRPLTLLAATLRRCHGTCSFLS